MRKPSRSFSRSKRLRPAEAFTLTETVIAIGVLAVLLTGFIAVFTPAAQGIRRAISSEQADRLTTTLEMELVTLRTGQTPANATTGFDKAFDWILNADDAGTAIFVYQYRGDADPNKEPNPDPGVQTRTDGTLTPVYKIGGQPGSDFIIQSVARRADDPKLAEDLKAIEGSVFYVKATQLVYSGGELILGSPGEIKNADGEVAGTSAAYKEAVIAFSAEFYGLPTKSMAYISSDGFKNRFTDAKKPIFTRNLAVRR